VRPPQELAEAQACEALINAGRPLATGRAARLVKIISANKEEERGGRGRALAAARVREVTVGIISSKIPAKGLEDSALSCG